MNVQIRIVAILATVGLLLFVLELVRRRRLQERYALVWLLVTSLLIALSAWGGLLDRAAAVIGISYPPSALFVIAFGFVILLLLHFSVAVSRLTDQSKVLAQRLALLEARVRDQEARSAGAERLEPVPELERSEA